MFVFDGTPPMLKAETLLNRRRARMKAEDDLHRIAERILLNQLKLSTIARAKQLLKEGKLQLADALNLGLGSVFVSGDPVLVEDSTNAEDRVSEKPKDVDLDASVSDLDRSLLNEDDTAQFVNQFSAEELRSMDASGSFVTELPKEMQMALLSEMKAAHRGHVGVLSLASPKRLSGENYSTLQMEQLVHKGGISRKLESVRDELDQEIFKPIASDPKVRYRVLSTSSTPVKSLLHVDSSVRESTQSADTPQVRVVLGTLFSAVDTSVTTPSTSSISNVYSISRPTPSQTDTTSSASHHPNGNPSSVTRNPPRPLPFPLSPRNPPLPTSLSLQEQLVRSTMPSLDPDLELIDLISDDDDDDDNDLSSGGRPLLIARKDSAIDIERYLHTQTPMDAQNEDVDEQFDDVVFEDVSSSAPIGTQIVNISTPSSPYDVANFENMSVHGDTDAPESRFASFPSIFNSSDRPHQKDSYIMELVPKPSSATAFGECIDDQSDVQVESSSAATSVLISGLDVPKSLDNARKTRDLDDTIGLDVIGSEGNVDKHGVDFPPSSASSSTRTLVAATSSQSTVDSSRTMSFSAVGGGGSELDLSTESQKMPSVNQSVVSEEEVQRVSLRSFENLEEELKREVTMLQGEAIQGQNQAVTLTSEAVDEAKELLRLFGIPFVQSPSEADAQCAILQNLGLVDGIVSDDSDILVFGGDTVFRYAFSQYHELELYNMEDIQTELGLNHHSLVFLAMLLGGDYADGISKVGPKVALDIVTEFPGPDGMAHFKSWIQAFQQGHEDYDMVLAPPSAPFVKRYAKLLSTIKLPESFPHPSVIDAYQNPSVDPSKEAFSWGWPNLAGLRQFALDKFGWTKDRVDTNILPIIQRYTAALLDKQPKIETFFTQTSIHGRKRTGNASTPNKRAPPRTTSEPLNTSEPSSSKTSNRKKRGRTQPSAVQIMETIGDSNETEEAESQDAVASLPPSKRYKRSNFD